MVSFNPDVVREQQAALERHPVYGALRDIDDLRVFAGELHQELPIVLLLDAFTQPYHRSLV